MISHAKNTSVWTPQLLLSIGISVATVALGWGVITTKQQAAEQQIQELKQNTVSKDKLEAMLFLMHELKDNIQNVRNELSDLKKTIMMRRARMESANH